MHEDPSHFIQFKLLRADGSLGKKRIIYVCVQIKTWRAAGQI